MERRGVKSEGPGTERSREEKKWSGRGVERKKNGWKRNGRELELRGRVIEMKNK
jgi:hypothetical protein